MSHSHGEGPQFGKEIPQNQNLNEEKASLRDIHDLREQFTALSPKSKF